MMRALSSVYLRTSGWKLETARPDARKYVLIATPHTSNWDGVNLVMIAQSMGLSLSWMVKDSHIRGPQGWALKKLGAVAVDRTKKNNMVQQMIDEFREREEFVLAIPPEGTRGRTDYWKSGFYHIAVGAGVPIVPGYLDFSRKRGGLGPLLTMTGDVHADMDQIRAYYDSIGPVGKFPDEVGPIRLREEEDA